MQLPYKNQVKLLRFIISFFCLSQASNTLHSSEQDIDYGIQFEESLLEEHPAEDIEQDTPPQKSTLRIKPYGFIRLDMMYADRNFGSLPVLIPKNIPLNSNRAARHPDFLIDARGSRVGLKATDHFKEIDLLGCIEIDFFTKEGDAIVENGRVLRLRLAFLQANFLSNFFLLAGQYWSLFKNSEFLEPKLLDYWGPVGSPFSRRQPQLRLGYRCKIDENNTMLFQTDIEKHALNTLGVVEVESLTDTSQGSGQKLPVFISKISWNNRHFIVDISGATAQSNITVNETGKEENKWVWAADLRCQIRIHPIILFSSIHHLNGLSCLGGEDFKDLAFNTKNQLLSVRSYAWYVGMEYTATKNLFFHLVYAQEKAHPLSGTSFSGNVKGEYTSLHANVLYNFWKRCQLGIEFQRDTTKSFNRVPGHVNLIHTALSYFF